MTKGPLVWAAVILAILLMAVSAIMILDRDLFLQNTTAITAVSGVLAIAVVVVLFLMLFRMKKQHN